MALAAYDPLTSKRSSVAPTLPLTWSANTLRSRPAVSTDEGALPVSRRAQSQLSRAAESRVLPLLRLRRIRRRHQLLAAHDHLTFHRSGRAARCPPALRAQLRRGPSAAKTARTVRASSPLTRPRARITPNSCEARRLPPRESLVAARLRRGRLRPLRCRPRAARLGRVDQAPLSSGVHAEKELAQSGLASEGQRGVYDRFRGRIVWPIRDTSGQTVGFGARKLYEDDNGPKYLNTPETPIYHKSRVLYGLDLAKRAISKGKRVVVVEGYTDVMACHLAGEKRPRSPRVAPPLVRIIFRCCAASWETTRRPK